MGELCSIRIVHGLTYHKKGTCFQRIADGVGIGHGDYWIGRHNPYCFDPTIGYGIKHIDGFQTG